MIVKSERIEALQDFEVLKCKITQQIKGGRHEKQSYNEHCDAAEDEELPSDCLSNESDDDR